MLNEWLNGINAVVSMLLAAPSEWQNGCCSSHHICIPNGKKKKMKGRASAHVRQTALQDPL